MTWREDLRRVTMPDGRRMIGASFRGVPFYVDTEEVSGGRRAVVHQFPLRDAPFVEDLGADAIGFRIDGYVIGDDYLSHRDDLVAALQGVSGPGELVLPGWGTKRAVCLKWSVRGTRAEGGMATFALDFAEAPTQAPVPTEVVDSAEQVDASATEAVAATKAEFVEKYAPEDLPSFALESASDALTKASEGLAAKLAPVTSVTQELAVLTGQVALLTAQASSLVRQPDAVLDAFLETIVGLAETSAAAPEAVMQALIDAYAVDLGAAVVATTATRQRELDNQNALTGALRRLISIEAARRAPLVPYESIEEAAAARDAVAAMLEEQAGFAGDTAYPALVDLRSELMRAVPGAAQLARVITYTAKVATPSLVLAHRLYGSVDNEADIIARNGISHPGFIVGELRVLSDG